MKGNNDMKTNKSGITSVLCIIGAVILTQGLPAIAARPPVKVFILAGQSNMEGQAVADLDGKDYNDGKGTLNLLMRDPAKAPLFKHLKDKQGRWTVRDDVWVRYKLEDGPVKAGPLTLGFTPYEGRHHFGPELQFGHVLGDHFTNQVLLIKTAWGGKSLYQDFRPPSSGGTVGPYYTKMLADVREALANLKTDFPGYDGGGYELAGFVWYHGWNDGCDPKKAVPEYEQNLVNFIKDVRKDLNAPRLPFVIGELTGPWVEAPGEWATLRKAQAAAAARPEFQGTVLFVQTHDFVRKPEDSPNPGHGHHEFGNAETYFLVGDALGKGMKKLLTTPQAGLLSPVRGAAPEPSVSALEKQFRELPMEARRWTGPLFWLHGDDTKERLEMYVGKVAEGGNGCFTAESRPHNDWLGEGWYRDLAICLEAAKKNDLKMWIFDEKWWPSGEVAGKVPQQYGSKRMAAAATGVTGPKRFTAAGYGGPDFIAALAGKVTAGGVDGASLVDLSPSIRDGALDWAVPEGEWKVMRFTWEPRKSGERYLVDGASRDSVDWYLRTVYQPHFDRFKEDFGKSIVGFFYDEPETHGDWGAEVMKVLAERKVDWKRALVAWKFQLAGEEQAAARYQYQDALAEAWGRTLYGGITRWCHEHGVRSIGHFLEHGSCYLNQDLCAGNMFQLMRYSDMGALDAVFAQFVWGKRQTSDSPVWQTPKMGSSITHAYGKPDDVTMVEIFGARGQDLTYPEMKWWADHMQVSGVNFLIPHSFNPRSPRDTDCPPYFYNGGFEPRWPLYRVFADYTSRLSVMLTGGRHVAPVALLFLGGSAHVGKSVTPEQISEALQDALYDCDWIPYEVFENGMTLAAGRRLKLREESYKVLIVPPVEVIPYATLAKAKRFFERGGVVVAHGFLPKKSATLGKTSADIAALCEAVWGAAQPGLAVCKTSAAGGRSYLLPEKPTPEQLRQVLGGDAGIRPTLEVVEGRTDGWLHVLHRVKAGRDVFFITNQNHEGGARRFGFRITAAGVPECWDAMRNEITAVPHRREGREVALDLTMEPNESVLLVFQPEQRALPMRLEAGAESAAKSIPIVREAVAPPLEPKLEVEPQSADLFEGSSWVWYPEDNPAQSAPPGERCFRKQLNVGADRKITKAVFAGTADNGMTLFINGKDAGHSDESGDGWRNPVELDVTAHLRPGVNQLAVSAFNATDKPSPAGLLGLLRIEFEQGEPLTVRVDGSWKASREKQQGWTEAGYSDSAWPTAREVAPFGGGPWGRLTRGQITLSPVKADPFFGHCEIPAGADLKKSRVYLELDELAPEAAARVTVNDHFAGGFIGRPLRLDVTAYLKPGANTIRIEPFAPKSAQLVIYAPGP
jgi:hypothetical protein